MSAPKIRVGLVQMSMAVEKAPNLDKAEAMLREAASRGAELVCLPELFASQYFCQSEDSALFDLAESIPGPTTTRIGEVAKALKISVVTPLFERRAAGLYHNSLVVNGPDGSIVGTYRKMHIPDDPLFYEKYYFTPGDLGFMAIPMLKV